MVLPCRVIEGKTSKLFDGLLTGSGTKCIDFTLDTADTILASLYVRSLTSGTIDVVVRTYTVTGESVDIITFPTLSAPTADLVLKKAATGLNNMQLCITHTGDAEVSIYGKGIATGEASVRILGASEGRASQQTVPSTPTVIVPSALVDRAGLVLKNNDTTKRMYIGFTSGEANTTSGYPISPGESIGIDMAAGVAIWGVAESGTIDVRILEANS